MDFDFLCGVAFDFGNSHPDGCMGIFRVPLFDLVSEGYATDGGEADIGPLVICLLEIKKIFVETN